MIASAVRADAEAFVDAQADLEAAPEAPIVYDEGCSNADDPCAKGKEKKKEKGSRWNAVRHGCMAKLLLPADLEIEVQKCTATLTEHYRPTSDHEVGIIATLGRLAAQIERNQQMKVVDLQRTMDRAVLCWDEDRYTYVYTIVKELGRVPGVAAALGQSKQGADWLLRTWQGLRKVLEKSGKWSEEESRLVLDLLEIRAELRSGFLTILSEEDTEGLALIVTEEVDRIEKRLKACVLAVDDADRWLAAAGMPLEENAGTKRLRKQEGKLKLEYRRAKAELLESRAQAAAAAAGPAPAAPESPSPVVASTRPEPAQKPAPMPRPTTSNAAWNYLQKRQDLEALELPETATSPAQRVAVRFPFPGGDPEPEPGPEAECEPEPELEPEADLEVVLAEPAPVQSRSASVATNASPVAVANQRRDRDRKARRDQEKMARKAARRKRR